MKNFNIPTISNTRQVKMDAKAFLTYADKHSDIIESSKFVPAQLGSDSFGYFIVEEKGSISTSCLDGDYSFVIETGK